MKLLISLTFLLSGTLAWSQSSKSAAWLDYNHTQFLNPDLAMVGDMGYRIDFSDPMRHITYLRPGVNYRFNSTFSIQGNLSTFLTFSDGSIASTEYRLAQEGKATWPRLKNMRFAHRLRFEERFIRVEPHGMESSEVIHEEDYRMRYMLSGTTDYFNLGPLGNSYLTGSIEYFAPIADETTENFSDESRVYIGYGQLLAKGWSYVLHFMWQRSKNTMGDFIVDEFIVRLRIYWKSSI